MATADVGQFHSVEEITGGDLLKESWFDPGFYAAAWFSIDLIGTEEAAAVVGTLMRHRGMTSMPFHTEMDGGLSG